MTSAYGQKLRFEIFGTSHGPSIGVIIEGIPAGVPVDMAKLQKFLSRRAPGGILSTPRKEADVPVFSGGLVDGVTDGSPIKAEIFNTNTRSGDYQDFKDCPRPGHADYTAQMRYGSQVELAGGGHFSGRLTAPLCIVGGICLQILEAMGIIIASHIQSVGTVSDEAFDPVQVNRQTLEALLAKDFPVLGDGAEAMKAEILAAKAQGDSIGGVIETAAVGVPAGWGDPMFSGMENRIAQVVFGIPAVRGIEFGTGFAAAKMFGSDHNDAYCMDGGQVRTETNHHGGILGGITSGMPVVFRAAVKPTPSIFKSQQTVSLSQKENTLLNIRGRHDPCIVPRAVPVMEAALAVALYDGYLCTREG